MDIKELKPTSIWHYFDAITGVPRPSKKEERIREFLLNFAKEQNLEVKVDKTGNVVITKEATPGCEGAPTVILQAHMDMVCEKNGDVKHDFERDPIETYIDGEWVKARGTTLGADNGIGMAAAMAVLVDKELKHGRIFWEATPAGIFIWVEETPINCWLVFYGCVCNVTKCICVLSTVVICAMPYRGRQWLLSR